MPRGFGPPWWHSRFRAGGFRITLPRQKILNILASTEGHLSAEDIYLKLHRRYPAGGLTTVYRTLELLVNIGLVRRFDFGDGRARYELIRGPKGYIHHHHLVCTNCGRVIDYTEFIDEEKELLEDTERGLSKKYNFKILDHQLSFLGLCNKCQGR